LEPTASGSGIDRDKLATVLNFPDHLLADGLDECGHQGIAGLLGEYEPNVEAVEEASRERFLEMLYEAVQG